MRETNEEGTRKKFENVRDRGRRGVCVGGGGVQRETCTRKTNG